MMYTRNIATQIYALALESLNLNIICSSIDSAFLTLIPHFLSSFCYLTHGQICINSLSHQQHLPLRHAWMLGATSSCGSPVDAAHLHRMQTSHQRDTYGRKSSRTAFIRQRPWCRLHSTIYLGLRKLRYRDRRFAGGRRGKIDFCSYFQARLRHSC